MIRCVYIAVLATMAMVLVGPSFGQEQEGEKRSVYTAGYFVSAAGATTIGLFAFGWDEDDNGNQEFKLKRPELLVVGVGLVVAGIAIDQQGRKVELRVVPNGVQLYATF